MYLLKRSNATWKHIRVHLEGRPDIMIRKHWEGSMKLHYEKFVREYEGRLKLHFQRKQVD